MSVIPDIHKCVSRYLFEKLVCELMKSNVTKI